mmetsp:Transcript_30729/g.57549  ORF Transcript_30729/g.57549 Transcript_30729/m.57549 type:complete len:95 (-) Transcript_30729:589-873(-)
MKRIRPVQAARAALHLKRRHSREAFRAKDKVAGRKAFAYVVISLLFQDRGIWACAFALRDVTGQMQLSERLQARGLDAADWRFKSVAAQVGSGA